MKISKIKIKDFYQFKNLELDLTYPKGHPKAGKPLDKVCIIGQRQKECRYRARWCSGVW